MLWKQQVLLIATLSAMACLVVSFPYVSSGDGGPPYTITFDPNGGECPVESLTTDSDGRLPYLPEATCEGYSVFVWWGADDWYVPTAEHVFTSDTVLQAQWNVFIVDDVVYEVSDQESLSVDATGLNIVWPADRLLDIPLEIAYGGNTYRVVNIGNGILGDPIRSVGITEFNFDCQTEKLDISNPACGNLKKISVTRHQTTGSNYVVKSDGALYYRNYDTHNVILVLCPPALELEEGLFEIRNVQRIEDYAFQGNTNLKTIIFDSYLTNIGKYAFESCANLGSFEVKEDNSSMVMSIEECAFSGCKSLDIDTTGDNLFSSAIYIGDEAFEGCISLTSVYVSESLYHVDDGAFNGCSSLTCFVAPIENQRYLVDDGCLFEFDGSVSDGVILHTYPGQREDEVYQVPKNCTQIGQMAFSQTKVKEVGLNQNFVTIGVNQFYGAASLERITLPSSVTHVAAQAFQGCTNLSEVVFGDYLYVIDMMAFQGCVSLKSVSLPGSVHTIGAFAFAGCGFESVTVPSGVTAVGSGVFSNCPYLTAIAFDPVEYGTDEDGAPLISDFIRSDWDLEEMTDVHISITGHRGVLDRIDFGPDADHITISCYEDRPFPMMNLVGIQICLAFLGFFINFFRRLR